VCGYSNRRLPRLPMYSGIRHGFQSMLSFTFLVTRGAKVTPKVDYIYQLLEIKPCAQRTESEIRIRKG
jgi:hypothetical protein